MIPVSLATLPIYVSHRGVNILGRDGLVQSSICVTHTQFGTTAAVVNTQVDKLHDILDIHSDVFKEGLGCCNTATASLTLREEALQNFVSPGDYHLQ